MSAVLKGFRDESRAFAAKHLKECAGEIIEWHDTAVLRDGRVRELAALCGKFIDNHDQLRVAESLINRAAIDTVAAAPPRSANRCAAGTADAWRSWV